MVEFKSDDTNLSRRSAQLAVKTDDNREEQSSDSDHMDDKVPDEVFEKEGQGQSTEPNVGLLSRLSGGVINTASSAVGTAYGGVTWVAGGVWSTTGTAIGATYNTVSALSPVNIFRRKPKSKSD